MSTNNATDTNDPVAISQGGTNASSMATTDGVVYYDGTRLVTTAVGTATQVLTSNGPAVAPTFQSGGGGTGGLVLLSSQTASNSATIDFTSVITGTYNNYFLIFSNVVPVVNTDFLKMLVSINNGSTWVGGPGYPAGISYVPANGTSFTNQADPFERWIPLSGPLSNVAGGGVNGTANLFNTGNGAYFATTGLCIFNGSTSGPASMGWFGDSVDTAGPQGQIGVNALRFLMSTGNISTGVFSLYGLAE